MCNASRWCFLLFQCSIFRSPLFFLFPFLYNCTFDAEEFDKSVVHKMSAVDFCGATAPEKEQHVSTTSATFSLEGRGGISRKMIKGPQYKQTASLFLSEPTLTHTVKVLLLLIRRMSSAEFRRNIFSIKQSLIILFCQQTIILKLSLSKRVIL